MASGDHLPLEDTFGDIVRKAIRGTGTSAAQVAENAGIQKRELDAWLKDDGAPDEAQARAVARVLRLDAGKLADSAAQRWYPPHIERDDVAHHPQKPHPSNGYVLFLDG